MNSFNPKSQVLTSLPIGKEGIVDKINDEFPYLYQRLQSLGIRPGSRINIVTILAFGAPVIIRLGEFSRLALRYDEAQHIFVCPTPA